MAELLTINDKRTCYCAELSAFDIGKHVCVMGWAQKQRDLGSLIFIDLHYRRFGSDAFGPDDSTIHGQLCVSELLREYHSPIRVHGGDAGRIFSSGGVGQTYFHSLW